MSNKEEIIKTIECICSTPEHAIRLIWYTWPEPEWNELAVEVHLTKLRWHKRLWYGLKYILGFSKTKCGFSCFDTGALDIDGVKELRDTCNQFLKFKNEP